jgi:hypothetical protein
VPRAEVARTFLGAWRFAFFATFVFLADFPDAAARTGRDPDCFARRGFTTFFFFLGVAIG